MSTIIKRSGLFLALFLFYFIFFLINGLGILSQENIFSITFLPNIIFLIVIFFYRKKLLFPWQVVFYLLFLIFSLPASFHNSFNLGLSIKGFFFYLNILVTLIFFLNNQPLANKIVKAILEFMPVFFIFIFLLTLVNNQWPQKLGLSEYNFFFSFYQRHNHLGDLLGLAIIYSFFTKKTKHLLFFLPFFLFSFSRSAFLALVVVLSFYLLSGSFKNHFREKTGRLRFLLMAILIIGSLVFFLIKTGQLVSKTKQFLDPRFYYFLTAIKGIASNPFGIGFFNFGELSAQEKVVGGFSSEIHNFFLEILLGVGLPAFGSFVLFLIFFLKKIYQKYRERFFLLLYLTIVFSFDYVYNIFFFFIFFFILLAGSFPVEEKKSLFLDKRVAAAPMILLLVFAFAYFSGFFFYRQKKLKLAVSLYPFNKDFQVDYIMELISQKKISQAAEFVRKHERYFPRNHDWLMSFYSMVGNCQKTLEHAKAALNNYFLPYFFRLRGVFYRVADCYGEDFAYQLIKDAYWFKKTTAQREQDREVVKKIFRDWCVFDNKNCQKIFGEKEMVFYHSPPSYSKEKSSKDLPITATYTFNNDGFNERFDYSVKKPKNTFRILVLGDNNAFGFLVDTEKNWVEQLEDKLKTQNSKLKANYKNFEVINLAYHSYDLAYAIERFRRDGIKYQPDLIIFMNNNFLRINEIFLPLTEKYAYLENNPTEKEKLKKEGKHFPSWQLAWEEYLKLEKCHLEVYQKQKKYLEEFFSLYRKKVIFVSFEKIPPPIKEFLEDQKQVTILELTDFSQNKEYYFKEISAINQLGQQKLADLFFDFLLLNH